MAAFDVHRFEGVVAGLWAVRVPGVRLTFIGIPTRRPWIAGHDALVDRRAGGRRAHRPRGRDPADTVLRRASEITLRVDPAASRRTARRFDARVERLRPVVQALRDGLMSAATRIDVTPDLFLDDTLVA